MNKLLNVSPAVIKLANKQRKLIGFKGMLLKPYLELCIEKFVKGSTTLFNDVAVSGKNGKLVKSPKNPRIHPALRKGGKNG